MVFAVQCPEPKCKKFQLVEDEQRGQIVPCLICKTPIKVSGDPSKASPPKPANPAKP